ncbi:MAG: DUF3810 domain-containing protein [Christensenellales bacterium]
MHVQTKRYLLRFLWLLIVPATWVLIALAKQNPAFIEQVYSNAFYPAVSFILPFRYLRYFSFFEVLLIALPLSALFFLVRRIIRIIRMKTGRLWAFLHPLQNLMIAGAVLYLLFYLLWGFNYYREPYSQIAGLDTSPGTSSELAAVCRDLIRKTNDARAALPSRDKAPLAMDLGTEALQDKSKEAFSLSVQKKIPGLRSIGGYGKTMASSRLVSYTGIAGIFFPYTGEPNINNDAPLPSLGSAMCHELAHLQGFSREDEASFISYLVCTSSGDPYMRYSGYLMAAMNAMNRLYEADYQAFAGLHDRYSNAVLYDLDEHNSYWAQFEGPVADTVEDINDSYLKSNNQTDGVQSYGRMVDLLLAQYRAGAFYNS